MIKINLFRDEKEINFTNIIKQINESEKYENIKLNLNKNLQRNNLNEILKCIQRIPPKEIFIEINVDTFNNIKIDNTNNKNVHFIINIEEKDMQNIEIKNIKAKYSFRINNKKLKQKLEKLNPYNIFIDNKINKEKDKIINKKNKTINEKITEQIIKPINKKLNLDISLDEVYRLMIEFETNNDFWKIVEKIGYPLPIIIQILEGLEKLNLIEINNLEIKIKHKFSRELKQIQDFSKQRLDSNENYCQLLVKTDDLIKRIQFLSECCKTGGKIAILGDDDFISLSIASTNIFDEVTVFEIDQRIVNKLNDIAKQNNLNLKAIQQDLKNRVPNRYLEKFDAFYTDSTYCENGFKLFVSRGVELLKNQPKCHGFVSFSPEIPVIYDTELPVQKLINEMGLFIEKKNLGAVNIIPKEFRDKYTGFAGLKNDIFTNSDIIDNNKAWYLACLGRKEYLFHLLTTKNTKSLLEGEFKEQIYYTKRPLDFYKAISTEKTKNNYSNENKNEFNNFCEHFFDFKKHLNEKELEYLEYCFNFIEDSHMKKHKISSKTYSHRITNNKINSSRIGYGFKLLNEQHKSKIKELLEHNFLIWNNKENKQLMLNLLEKSTGSGIAWDIEKNEFKIYFLFKEKTETKGLMKNNFEKELNNLSKDERIIAYTLNNGKIIETKHYYYPEKEHWDDIIEKNSHNKGRDKQITKITNRIALVVSSINKTRLQFDINFGQEQEVLNIINNSQLNEIFDKNRQINKLLDTLSVDKDGITAYFIERL